MRTTGKQNTKSAALHQPLPEPSPQPTEGGKTIRVRMYRVGFGDCFLLSLPVGDGQRHILIDCGVHSKGDIGTMPAVVADIVAETGGKIAVVVATHHHQDHISGFGIGADEFAGVAADEVWLPWTENPDDKNASGLRKRQLALANTLRAHFAATAEAEVHHALDNFLGLPMLGVASNDKSMNVLRSGFAGPATLRYLKAGDRLDRPASIPGLSVQVLGPPTDERFLAKMDPPKGHTYISENGSQGDPMARPFAAEWTADTAEVEALVAKAGLSPQDRKLLVENALTSLDELAFTLDQAVNNTSLVLLVNFGGKDLLFAGDAQWGNWQSWVDGDGAKEILQNICFYKVAHHGSVNATPTDALSKMVSPDLAAMVSTQSHPWPSIPRLPLIGELAKRTGNRLFRSDSLPIQKAPSGPKVTKVPDGFQPGAPAGFPEGEQLWVDYFLKV